MKAFLKIKRSELVPKSNNKMIHEDEDGKLFLGPPISYMAGETIIAEISNRPMTDGYYHIIQIIDRISPKNMSESLNKLIETSLKMIDIAKGMLKSCQLKKSKVYSDSRFVVSFFLRRSWEMFESFLILTKENRIIDSAVLLRSLLEMGISLGYIFAKDIDETENEIRALTYMLDGNRQQLKLTNSNLEGFKEFDSNIEARRDELKEQIRIIEGVLKDKYGKEEWDLPKIEQRAILSKSDVLKKAYNQSYRDLSSIEHHNMLFGQHYVDSKECDPIEEINHLEHYSQLKPSVSLFLFRIVFIEILSVFNDVFQLNWDKQVAEIRKFQDKEYRLLKD